VDAFNTQLAAGLDTFESKTGLDVETLDLKTLFDGIAASPENYGFTNISQPVLVSTPGVGSTPTYNPAIVGQDPAVEHGSLFLDPYFNPTALGQAIIAQTARSTLTA
jgi:phospholipase/lecithinase/hemolysin